MAKSQKRTKSNNNNKKKLPWVSMQMYRVPLNPEQAVLTCCSQEFGRARVEAFGQCAWAGSGTGCSGAFEGVNS